MTPKVTVLMPVYNGEMFLREAVDSILGQSFVDFELLIVNDSSTDKSLSIIRSYHDSRIRLVNNDKNRGLIYSRNKGIDESRGEYIAMLDCDDVAYPRRLARQVLFLENNPEYAMVGSGLEIIDGEGRSSGFSVPVYKDNEVGPRLIFGNIFAQSSVMIRRNIITDYRYRKEAPFSEDYDLWIRLAEDNLIRNLPEILIKYRVYNSSTGTIKRREMLLAVRKIFIYQLKKLGINPTDEQIDLHLSVDFLKWVGDRQAVDKLKLKEWLLILIQKNRVVSFFPNYVFARVVTEKWIKFCYSVFSTRPLTFTRWAIFQSPSSSPKESMAVIYLLAERRIKKALILLKFNYCKVFKSL
jgi:glycosyltransferase involved in cell wall biosynthesis